MLAPSTSNERTTAGSRPDYLSAAATAAAAVLASNAGMLGDEHGHYNPYPVLQQQQQQQQQQQHHAHVGHAQVAHHGQHPGQLQQLHTLQQLGGEFETAGPSQDGVLQSRYIENEIIKTFPSKAELVKYVKNVLNDSEQCKIVINSSKPKAVYFQCERSGSFRTTVKDASKRQRVAYTKRNKCAYRLVANLYPQEKDKKRIKKGEDGSIDDKLNDYSGITSADTGEMWVLRMINPTHNHPPEPSSSKKKRLKFTRTLVQKPLHRDPSAYGHDMVLLPVHSHLLQHPQLHDGHTPSVNDAAVIAAMAATPDVSMHHQANPPVDPNIDPNVEEQDHAHGLH